MDLIRADHHDEEPGVEEAVDDLPVAAFDRDLGDTGAAQPADLVARRLAQLPDDAARILVEAAVLGPRILADVLPVVTGAPARSTTDALRRGVAAQLVVADPDDPRVFAFRHALTREALLTQVLPFERLDISRRALAALEAYDPELSGSLCEVAASLAESVGDGAVAARILLLAARRAAARGARSSAESMLERGWGWAAGHQHARVSIGSLLMEVLTEAGGIDRALEIGEQLRAEPLPPVDAAGVELGVARTAAAGSRWPIALPALDRVRRTVPALGPLADGVEAEVAFGRDRFDEAASLAASSLAFAVSDRRPELACRALQVLGVCARFEGDLDAAERAFDRVVAISREHGLSTWRVRGTMDRASLDAWRFHSMTRVLAARAEAVAAGALVVVHTWTTSSRGSAATGGTPTTPSPPPPAVPSPPGGSAWPRSRRWRRRPGRAPPRSGATARRWTFLYRAVAWFRDHGVQVLRVLTDNAKVYRVGRDWRAVCIGLGIRRRFTKPGCPWTNGKAERLHRTLLTEFAYARPWLSNADRLAALDIWVQHYNTRRAHSPLSGQPPITRLAA